MKITSLTQEQEADLAAHREVWRAHGLSTEPADFARAEVVIRDFYARLGKPAPVFLHFSSPAVCALAVAVLRHQLSGQLRGQLSGQLGGQLRGQLSGQLGGQLRDQLGGQLRDQLGGQLRGQLSDQLWDQLWDQLGDQLSDQLWDQLWDQLGDQLRGQLWDQLRGQLWDQLSGQLGDQLWDQLGDQLRGQLWDQLRGQLWDQLSGQLGDQLRGQLWDQLWGQLGGQLRGQLSGQLRGQLRGQLWDQLSGQLWGQLGGQLSGQLSGQLRGQLWKGSFVHESFQGQHEGAWLAYYSFAARIGVKYGDDNLRLLQAWCALAESVCWWAPYEGICIISDRPRAVHFDNERRLHRESGPAVAFSDGWGVHAWHGTRVPPEWIDDRANLKPEQVLATANMEQRRAGIEILGWDRILAALPSRVIDADPDPLVGTLLEIDLPGLEGGPSIKAQFLRVLCGTGRQFAMGIDPAARAKTALDAQAWVSGLSPDDFRIPQVRT